MTPTTPIMDTDIREKVAAMTRACTDDGFIASYLGLDVAQVASVRRLALKAERVPTLGNKPVVGENLGMGELTDRRIAAEQGSRALLLALQAYQRRHHPETPFAKAELAQ